MADYSPQTPLGAGWHHGMWFGNAKDVIMLGPSAASMFFAMQEVAAERPLPRA
jgi:hypothetical protein